MGIAGGCPGESARTRPLGAGDLTGSRGANKEVVAVGPAARVQVAEPRSQPGTPRPVPSLPWTGAAHSCCRLGAPCIQRGLLTAPPGISLEHESDRVTLQLKTFSVTSQFTRSVSFFQPGPRGSTQWSAGFWPPPPHWPRLTPQSKAQMAPRTRFLSPAPHATRRCLPEIYFLITFIPQLVSKKKKDKPLKFG